MDGGSLGLVGVLRRRSCNSNEGTLGLMTSLRRRPGSSEGERRLGRVNGGALGLIGFLGWRLGSLDGGTLGLLGVLGTRSGISNEGF